jgi:hypothetical protein
MPHQRETLSGYAFRGCPPPGSALGAWIPCAIAWERRPASSAASRARAGSQPTARRWRRAGFWSEAPVHLGAGRFPG